MADSSDKLNRRQLFSRALRWSVITAFCPIPYNREAWARPGHGFAFWRAAGSGGTPWLSTTQAFVQIIGSVGNSTTSQTTQSFVQIISSVGNTTSFRTTQVFAQVVASVGSSSSSGTTQVFVQVIAAKP